MRKFMFILAAFVAFSAPLANAAGDIAGSEKQIVPILLGTALPDAPLRTLEGERTTLHSVVGHEPTVLVFFRGGWCPYCNLQLSELRKVEADLKKLGYQIVAVSPDNPDRLRKTKEDQGLKYKLVADDGIAAISAMGIAYKMKEETLRQYEQAGVKPTQGVLPVPAVFIVDGSGEIQFSYAHPDFRVRVPAQVVLAAARAIAQHQHKLQPKAE